MTPMQQHYHDAKAACPDALLLFRMGDFYELFYDDAKTAAKVLGLSLTVQQQRAAPDPAGADELAMAGFPHRQLEAYLRKLLAEGYKAAICEAVTDPAEVRKLKAGGGMQRVQRVQRKIVGGGLVGD